MANYQAKCQELLRFIPDLQCHKCKDVPGPNGSDKNRYSCVDLSHTLCEKDKLKCPCGSLVAKNPSPITAKLIEDLPWMCQNYNRGCREIQTFIPGLEFHQRKCNFRQIQCPDLGCSQRNIELLFKDLTKHLNDYHANHKEMHILDRNVWMSYLIRGTSLDVKTTSQVTQHLFQNPLGYIPPRKMKTTCGAVFFFEACLTQSGSYCWVNFVGSLDDAKNFAVEFHTANESEKSHESFTYNGSVRTLDEDQALGGQGCFFLPLDAVGRCVKNGGLKIMISIKNSKDQIEGEDQRESDDSEEKPTVKKRRRSQVVVPLQPKTEVQL